MSKRRLVYLSDKIRIWNCNGEFDIEIFNGATQEEINRARSKCGLPVEVNDGRKRAIGTRDDTKLQNDKRAKGTP